LTDKAAKLFVWYALYAIVFRCPSRQADITDGTPSLCGPYLATRDFVQPYAQPYYDQYLAPHLHKAQPYLDRVNEQVYQPGLAAYQTHGAPRVQQAQEFGAKQWEKTVKPQLEVARQQAGKHYEATLGPHVKKVDDAVRPYYDSIKSSTTDIWQLEIEPVYRSTAPYAQKFYTQGRQFAVQTALPQAQYASSAAWSFWVRQIWPKVRVLYGENVEPQLMRITERLGTYKDGKKLQAEVKSMEASSSLAEASSSVTSATSLASSVASAVTDSPSSAATVAASEATAESTVTAAEHFKADLESWEKVCVKAVDEGAEDLKERIRDIADHHSSSQVGGTAKALIIQLEETTEAAMNSAKAHILSTVGGLPEGADGARLEEANDAVTKAIRKEGQHVKQSAQAVREWKQQYETDLDSSVHKALQSTLETIDGIRELRLTEIGHKYADKDLAHKEWSKYNELKKATRAWRDNVEKVTSSNTDISRAKQAGEEIEQRGMSIAEEAAKELGRLKEVAKWKVQAGDATDDFNTKKLPAAVEHAKKSVVDKAADASDAVSEAVVGSSEPVKGSVESATSVASEKASEMSSSASEAVLGSSSSALSDTVADVTSKASEAVLGSQAPGSQLSDSVAGAASKASEAVRGSETPSAASISSAMSSKIMDDPVSKSLGPKAASILAAGKSRKDAAGNSASSVATDGSSMASSVASDASASGSSAVDEAASSVSSVATDGSSMASSVASDASASPSSAVYEAASSVSSAGSVAAESVSSLSDDAGSSVSSASQVAANAIPTEAEDAEEGNPAENQQQKKVFAGAMAQVLVEAREPILDDTVEDSYSESMQSMVNVAMDEATKLTQAVADAMRISTATGAEGAVESVTSLASEQYQSAVSAASSVLFGTGASASKGSAAAKEQYLSAVEAASNAIYGTPTTAAAMSSASSLTDSVLSQTASATAGAASAASARYDEAVNQASQHYAAAKSRVSIQVSGTPKPVHQQMFASVESAYSDSVAAASERLQAAISAVSPTASASGLFAKSTQGAYESISSIASSRLAEGLGSASAQYESAKVAVGIEPTPAHQAYLASAQRAYYEGIGMAHDRYSSFVNAASSAVGAAPTTGYQVYLAGAQVTYSSALAAASSNLNQLRESASSAAGVASQIPGESVLAQMSSAYDSAVAAASSQLDSASSQASQAIYGTEKGSYHQATDAAGSVYTDYASAASSAMYGSETPWTEAMASQASQNWDALISRASDQVYGQPAPFTDSVYSQATAYAAQATQAAAQQYEAVQALFSELVSGREPDFTDSVMLRLQSAYSTGAPAAASGASSYASEAYASASSAVSAVFTPPATLDTLMAQVNEQLNGAVDATSGQFYGSSKGTYDSATEYAASAYSDAASQVSEAVYGHQTGSVKAGVSAVRNHGKNTDDSKPRRYAEDAQSSMQDIASAASRSISEAIYGTPTGTVAAASHSAASVYDSLTSAASAQAAAVSSAVSSAMSGEEKGYVEGLQQQISAAMVSAQARIAEFGEGASSVAAGSMSQVSEQVVEAVSSVGSAASQATSRVRDEL